MLLRRLLMVTALAAAAALRGAAPFPQDLSDLKADPAATFGILPNGLRYVVRPNPEPRNRASLRLVVLTGSLEEKENQRGLAHFLEHMAFNGSTHYAPGTLVEYFQRLGMSFGGDTNAYTSFDHTAFMIELPDTKSATVAEGLRVLSDFAGGLLLPPSMVEKERPIILSEKRTRDSADFRQFVASFNFLLGGTLFPQRIPIGLTPVIQQAGRDRFADLYDTWYRPERMVAIVVGDVDPASAVAQIKTAFGPVADRAPARPDPDLGHVVAALGLRAGYDPEPEAAATTVSIDVVEPYTYQLDTAALRRIHLRRDLAVAMLNRRFEILSKKEGAPFSQGEASIGENFNFFRDAGVQLTCAPDRWQDSLGVAEQELRKALNYGFTDAELREAEANYANDLRQAAATAPTRRSPDIVTDLIQCLVNKDVFTSPQQDLALLLPELAVVTPGQCSDALRAAFAAPGRFVMVSGNAKIAGDAAAAVSAAYNRSTAVPVKPPVSAATEAFAYTDFGPAGTVIERKAVADLDLTEITFSNGVRVNLKKTPFEANKIRVGMRVGAGRLLEPKGEPGLALYSDISFEAGGLGKHSVDDLQRLLAGRTVGFEFKVADDALEFEGATNREDFLLQLELMAASVVDPGYRPEADRIARKEISEAYDEFSHSISGPLQIEEPRLLASGDTRFGLPTRAEVSARTLDEERRWLGPQLDAGPIEISIVGDFDPDAAVAALARTFGALPRRSPKPAYAQERKAAPPVHAVSSSYPIPTEIPKAMVALYWPTTDMSDIGRTRRLTVLGSILNDRLRVRIREQLGGAYAPQAGNMSSDTFTGYGLMVAEVVVAPERAAELRDAILAVAKDLNEHGASADELERARLPLLTQVRESVRNNGYWMDQVLSRCQEYPQRLDWARTREQDLKAIALPEVNELARKYLAPERAFVVIAAPRKP